MNLKGMICTGAVIGGPATKTAISTGMKGPDGEHLIINIEGPRTILDRGEATKQILIRDMRITTVVIEEGCLKAIGGVTQIDRIKHDQDPSRGLMVMMGRMMRKKPMGTAPRYPCGFLGLCG